jgi:hypothetical protein
MTSIRRHFCLVLAIATTALAASAAPALAANGFEIESFSGSTSSYGHFSRQAGAHADLTTTFTLTKKEFRPGTGRFSPVEDPRNVAVELPPGLIGNPSIIPTCTAAELIAGQGGGAPICSAESQVGIATIDIGQGPPFRQPVYNMERTPEQVGLFALNFSGVIIRFLPTVRSTDYGVNTLVPSISQAMPIVSVGLTLWAVPADPIHDSERYNPETFREGMESTAIPRPFMTNPTSCPAQPTVTHGTANSWQHPDDFVHAAFDSDPDGIPFIWKECERVPFKPTTVVQSGTHRAANPSGLDFRIVVPQPQDPEGIASAHVRKVVTEFPQGVSASPSAVAGLGACSLAQIKLGSAEAPTCPDSAKIGNVTIDTPLLEKPLEGEAILAAQNDNPFHSTFAVYLVAPGPGFNLKIPG